MKLMLVINKYYMYYFFIFELKSIYILKVEKIFSRSDVCIYEYLKKLLVLVLYKCINYKKKLVFKFGFFIFNYYNELYISNDFVC